MANLNLKYADKLPDRIKRMMREQKVPWGPVGFVTYKRTYSRHLDEDDNASPKEEYWQTQSRCLQGLLDINGALTLRELECLAGFLMQLKCNFSGRQLWQLGTKTVQKIGGDSLQACWHVRVDEPIHPFAFTFEELMLGGGVGFTILPEDVYSLPHVQYKVQATRVESFDCDFIISDNREGWIELLKRVLESAFYTNKPITYNTRCIRAKGERIRSFGGTASGPEDLVIGINEIVKILHGAHGRKLKPIECLDLMNILGMIVVAGNVRRSAQIANGSGRDRDFLLAKYWGDGAIIPRWRQQSNNTVQESNLENLLPEFWWPYENIDENGYSKGECLGLFNRELAANYGRLIDGPKPGYNSKVCGPNPCIPGDTWIFTSEGPRLVKDLLEKPFEAQVNGDNYKATAFFKTGTKQLYKVTTTKGYTLRCTFDHKLLRGDFNKIPLSELNVGDGLVLGVNLRDTDWGIQATDNVQRMSKYQQILFLRALLCSPIKISDTTIAYEVFEPLQTQRMLARFGVIVSRSEGKITVKGQNIAILVERLTIAVPFYLNTTDQETYKDTIASIELDAVEDVYDCTVEKIHVYEANGFIISNCGEIMLESNEACNLSELYLTNLKDSMEFHTAAILMYKCQKIVSKLPFLHERTNEVVGRNHRLGLGVTGFAAAHHLRQAPIFDSVYKSLVKEDKDFSKTMGTHESIAFTTVKPSGTAAKLPIGCTPGANNAYALTQLLRITFAADSPMLPTLRRKGYPMEPKRNIDGSLDLGSTMVSFPVRYPNGTPCDGEVSAIKQLENVVWLQTWWSDNAVSATIQFNQDEVPAIKAWMKENYTDKLKSISFSRHSGHGFIQAPNEALTLEEYEKFVASVETIDSFDNDMDDSAIEGIECGPGGCPVK